MGKYIKGTQEMLDAAKDDATLLPFDTEFRLGEVRVKRFSWCYDDSSSVAFKRIDGVDEERPFCVYSAASGLKPAKKSKPKKWQNGTQAQLDAAKDDARLIPKKTYFLSKRGNTNGMVVYRIPHHYNDETSVLMYASEIASECHYAEELEPINAD